MINRIMNGIIAALSNEFGEGYPVYTEHMEQGMQTPCFFVGCNSMKAERGFSGRWKLINEFSVQYHPHSDQPKQECNAICERLVWVLAYIGTLEEGFEGTAFSMEEKDGILTTTVHYDCVVYRKTESALMGELNMKGGLKNESKNRSSSKG